MRYLPKPEFTASETLDLCIESIRDQNLTQRLELVRANINDAESTYIRHGVEGTLYMVASTPDVAGQVSLVEMERVYAQTFVRSTRTRHIYDFIKKLPENDICPLCGQRTVFTLDHYLPQAAHPALVITSANLVPACGECNKIKLARQAANAEDQTLHPYFDEIDHAQWLFARVLENRPAALIFSPIPPFEWDQVKRERVISHFRAFGLGQLYASHSGVELNNMRFRLQMMAQRNSPQQISDHLRESEDSCAAVSPNSWQRATYQALANSEWFCNGGFGTELA